MRALPHHSAAQTPAVALTAYGGAHDRARALEAGFQEHVSEMRRLDDRTSPTSICVLCGALLEAALVAIAKPAQAAKAWRQNFLNQPAEKWELGHLIDQAKESGLFSPNLVAHAQTLGDVRNRTHAGKFANGGTLTPPHTDAHEARIAREHLDLLSPGFWSGPCSRLPRRPERNGLGAAEGGRSNARARRVEQPRS